MAVNLAQASEILRRIWQPGVERALNQDNWLFQMLERDQVRTIRPGVHDSVIVEYDDGPRVWVHVGMCDSEGREIT